MISEAEMELALSRLQTSDEVLTQAGQRVAEILRTRDEGTRLRLYIANFFEVEASEGLEPIYYTPNCVALQMGPSIIMNERFLLETEAAIRAFGQYEELIRCRFVLDEKDMFGLVGRIDRHLDSYLRRLRRADSQSHRATDAVDELTMVVLFFAAHELGHILHLADGHRFGAYIDPSLPLERRLDGAVVKMCRHLDEFRTYGFGLDGDKGGSDEDHAIREAERRLRAKDYEQVEAWFDEESAADQTATAVMLDFLSTENSAIDTPWQHSFIFGLFATAVFGWYRDLRHFWDALGTDGPFDVKVLALKMMEDKSRYIQAASLFGELHRFTLLRATLCIGDVIAETSGLFAPDSQDPRLQKSFRQCAERYQLLGQLMDTGVKLAYMGCANAWMLEQERVHGKKPFLMTFYSMRYEMERIYGRLP